MSLTLTDQEKQTLRTAAAADFRGSLGVALEAATNASEGGTTPTILVLDEASA